MNQSSVCPKCGSRKVNPDVRVLDRVEGFSDSLSVHIERRHDRLFFKGTEVVEPGTWVCGESGYAELCVTNPKTLWSAIQAMSRA